MNILLALLVALSWLFLGQSAHAACSPNQNANGIGQNPFIDNCALPAQGLNQSFAKMMQVPNNTQLAALARTGTFLPFYVIRQGFASNGDGGKMNYQYSATACTLNSGAGDNGSQVPASGGGCWLWDPPDGVANPKVFGAKGDGTTDDTAAINATIVALGANGGTVHFSPGTYCIKTAGGITANEPALTFDGQNGGGGSQQAASVTLSSCGADTTVITTSEQGIQLKDLKIIGSQTVVSPTHPAIACTNGATGADLRVIRSWISGGSAGINAQCYEIWVKDASIDHTYGPAIYLKNTGGYILNNKFDQAWPQATPANGIAFPSNWAATTSYTRGAVVFANGYMLQATVAGTSGSTAPTPLAYGTNITDGSVTWQIAGPNPYNALNIDTGSGGELYVEDNDFSSDYTTAIQTNNSGAGAVPSDLIFERNTFGSNLSHISLAVGHDVQIVDNQFGNCLYNGCSAISLNTSFNGDTTINDNKFKGASNSANQNAIFVGNSVFRTTITGNQIGNWDTGISIQANTQEFTIVGNELGGSSVFGNNTNGVVVAPGSSNFYTIVGNNTAGATQGIQDFGTGTSKLIIDMATPMFNVDGQVGLSCSGTPSASFASTNGIVTHC